MAAIRFKGLDEYIAKLERLTARSHGICKMAVWEGGKVVGDNIKSALSGIPVQNEYVQKGQMRKGIRSEQKKGIIDGFGLSKMRDEGGTISTKAGFHGTTDGKSNKALMRAVESGTSYMQKHPVVRQAVNKSRSAAEAAMRAKFEEETNKLMK